MNSPQIPPNIIDAVREDLFAGHKIVAIKRYRDATGCQLKDAKDAVDAFEAQLRVSDPGRFAHPPGSGGCGWLVVVLFLGGVVGLLAWKYFK